ncbi:S-adenosyl-L-methionine-dependent methyltransferase [Zopfia rhizophila CBS 207.26]|uniref:tRNA (adenine(58)-N(1))-methyltransferase catalytic subunit TRM61 n=1 Tax=Zopfia rhizophila CBS 207.26 TaxID=1314779 RepID=A0A6A6DD22_9PEZI|nr:S-adenosyl-L-methionine-dependent methyltransferase [Zopfia rhizophila CBS 207.26]
MRNSLLLHRVSPQKTLPIIRRQFTSTAFRSRVVEGKEFNPHYLGFATSNNIIEGDIVLLRQKQDPSHDGILVKLRQPKSTQTHRGNIQHSDVIGKKLRQIVPTSKGIHYRIHEPTLAEYVRLTPRLVTPIYPGDANIIVSLLDIHVNTPPTTLDDAPPLEILEAGTGHGALTLHLSRAIHAANPPVPTTPAYVNNIEESEDPAYLGETIADLQDSNLAAWKSKRRAIVHTIEISEKHSNHAQKIVQGFRHGIYAGNVDFHVGDVSEWIVAQREKRETEEPFLSCVFLDLPNANLHLDNVAQALKVDGLLAVFNPSITQIAECVELIRKKKLPYLLDKVVELGAGLNRQWDVRAVRPRATLKKEESEARSDDSGDGAVSTQSEQDTGNELKSQERKDQELAQQLAKQQEKWAIVCRPKVGEMVVGGGFLGVWRRMEPASRKGDFGAGVISDALC